MVISSRSFQTAKPGDGRKSFWKEAESVAEKENPCEGCFHFYGNYTENRCCNYIFDMGKKRPCPPGEQCTERIGQKEAWKMGLKKVGFI